jgi:predicted nucleotidyltransferase
MASERDLRIAHEIAATVLAAAEDRVVKLYLHGSRASQTARPTSDFDILVVMKDPVENWIAESMRLTDLFNDFPWPVDIQAFGETEFEELREVPGTLPYPAITRGVLLYDEPVGRAGADSATVAGVRA